ncbi:unnamed protein product [Arabis nemorensis]|uniref:Uncharacterized protein n=1 Tax=Arabis nemorensis TaxID=586526 RepID=A0A565BZB3_9BRAS|nr:unnamed protein product [Arabis nemorensis]
MMSQKPLGLVGCNLFQSCSILVVSSQKALLDLPYHLDSLFYYLISPSGWIFPVKLVERHIELPLSLLQPLLRSPVVIPLAP